jgi:hypothetical protein
MNFTLGRVVHFYYVIVLVAITSLFAYGVNYYWNTGILNIDYVSNLYDGTNKVKSVKERNDIEELKRFIDGDRLKDANKVFSRLEADIKDLKLIKNTDEESNFDERLREVKSALVGFQSAPELSNIISNITNRVSSFETFVSEKNWPTLTKMSINLRLRLAPSRLMSGGLYNYERTQNLSQSVNNDLEAMTNFVESSGLQVEIKQAIINRIKTIKTEAAFLTAYIESHEKFNRLYKDVSAAFVTWFKLVEPEIAYKKIQFEKSSQTIFYSLISAFALLVASIVLGFVIYNFSTKRSSGKTEKLIIDTIKEGLLPVESKQIANFSQEFLLEFEKYREYAHKRMAFGSIFQEAVPFATILLDSNLNMVWGNSHFYDQWQLQNFKEDEDTLTWDFLQRFTNLKDNSSILSALRMSTSGSYKIDVKSNTMSSAIPYEMFVSPVEYANQKRIMVIFYPMIDAQRILLEQKTNIITPLLLSLDLQNNEKMTIDTKNELRAASEIAGAGELFSKIFQYIEKSELIQDELNSEIEGLELKAHEHRNTSTEMRKSLISSFETQRTSINRYNQFKSTVTVVIDSRDQLEEQFKFAMNSSREIFKDQNRILSAAEKAEKNVDEYIKTLKSISSLKAEFKELKISVEDYKSRVVQMLDQLIMFQNHDTDTHRVDQFLGKIKIEMKGFEKVLVRFNDVVTMLDVSIVKVDLMAESRERVELDAYKHRMDSIKNNLENVQFSAFKIAQTAHAKDDEMINSLQFLVGNLKSEMKRINEMCNLAGMNSEHLDIIATSNDASI